MQVLFLLDLYDFADFAGSYFDGFVISVLNFCLFFEVECEFHDSLFFSTAELLGDQAFVIVLKSHTIQLLL